MLVNGPQSSRASELKRSGTIQGAVFGYLGQPIGTLPGLYRQGLILLSWSEVNHAVYICQLEYARFQDLHINLARNGQ